MGWNTTIVVMNDALHAIEEDPEFGKRLAKKIAFQHLDNKKTLDVSALGHVNAATIIEQHHADCHVLILAHGNYAKVIHREDVPKAVQKWMDEIGAY